MNKLLNNNIIEHFSQDKKNYCYKMLIGYKII